MSEPVISSGGKFEGVPVSAISGMDLFWLRARGGVSFRDRTAIDAEIGRRRAAQKPVPSARRRIQNAVDELMLSCPVTRSLQEQINEEKRSSDV